MSRFETQFPFASRLVLHPLLTLCIAFPLALIGGRFSLHYGLSVIILWLGLFAFYLDRRMLDYVLIPPFATVMVWEALGLGVGVSLVVVGNGGEASLPLLTMQAVHIALFPVAYAGYWLFFQRVPRVIFPTENPVFFTHVARRLAVLGWFFFLWRVASFTILAATGAEDRGDFGVRASGQTFGIWTFFLLLPRFNNFGFFLFPLIFRMSGKMGRVVLLGLLLFYEIVAFASGSRGIVIFPLCFIAIGWFLFSPFRLVRLELIAVVCVAAVVPLIPWMGAFRNTDAYRSSRTIDLAERLSATSKVSEDREEAKSRGDAGDSAILGRALIGVLDELIYGMTPSTIPHAGWSGFDSMLYTWIPVYLKRDRPILYDANAITAEYLGPLVSGSGRAITLQADLYRRFGWIGVPVGVIIAFGVYGAFCAYAYREFLFRNSVWGMLLILYTFSFFSARPFSTVLTTWWTWAYELPKHMIALFVIYFVVKMILGPTVHAGAWGFVPGAVAYVSGRKSKPAAR